MTSDKNIKLIETYTMLPQEERIRLSDLKAGSFKTITSRKGIKNAIKKGLVRVDGKIGKTGDYIKGGEIIELFQLTEAQNKPIIDLPLEVLFEDDYLAVINKPAGITVSGNKRWTLENALSSNLKKSTQKDEMHRPEPIHRLDHPTSGALLVGKTINIVKELNRLFETREIAKSYFAVTIGKMQNEGKISSLIDNKPSETDYHVVSTVDSEKYVCLNLVKLILHTGRRHQIRIHMSELGNPILGDKDYGVEGQILMGKGLYLHSASLGFIHPITREETIIKAPLPKKFLKLFPEIVNES
jgi:23S rRNA pseudouridine1911/1915/1917 synthase